jgi:hypothetical protein
MDVSSGPRLHTVQPLPPKATIRRANSTYGSRSSSQHSCQPHSAVPKHSLRWNGSNYRQTGPWSTSMRRDGMTIAWGPTWRHCFLSAFGKPQPPWSKTPHLLGTSKQRLHPVLTVPWHPTLGTSHTRRGTNESITHVHDVNSSVQYSTLEHFKSAGARILLYRVTYSHRDTPSNLLADREG